MFPEHEDPCTSYWVAGFDGAQESALDLLGELALRYAGEVGAGARSYAELAGRSSVTFSDVVRAVVGVQTVSSSPRVAAWLCVVPRRTQQGASRRVHPPAGTVTGQAWRRMCGSRWRRSAAASWPVLHGQAQHGSDCNKIQPCAKRGCPDCRRIRQAPSLTLTLILT